MRVAVSVRLESFARISVDPVDFLGMTQEEIAHELGVLARGADVSVVQVSNDGLMDAAADVMIAFEVAREAAR